MEFQSDCGIASSTDEFFANHLRLYTKSAGVFAHSQYLALQVVGGIRDGRLQAPKKISLVMYMNGIVLGEGSPFRPFSNVSARALVEDILDGYFPYELKSKHPEGVPLMFVDRHLERYEAPFAPFSGQGKVLGADAMTSREASHAVGRADSSASSSRPAADRDAPAKAHIMNIRQLLEGGGNGRSRPGDPISREEFLSRLPRSVVRNGNLIAVRSDIASLLAGEESPNSANKSTNLRLASSHSTSSQEQRHSDTTPSAGSASSPRPPTPSSQRARKTPSSASATTPHLSPKADTAIAVQTAQSSPLSAARGQLPASRMLQPSFSTPLSTLQGNWQGVGAAAESASSSGGTVFDQTNHVPSQQQRPGDSQYQGMGLARTQSMPVQAMGSSVKSKPFTTGIAAGRENFGGRQERRSHEVRTIQPQSLLPQEIMELKIRSEDGGQTFSVELKLTDTVADLRRVIDRKRRHEERGRKRVYNICSTFPTRVLEAERETLLSLGVSSRSVLLLQNKEP